MRSTPTCGPPCARSSYYDDYHPRTSAQACLSCGFIEQHSRWNTAAGQTGVHVVVSVWAPWCSARGQHGSPLLPTHHPRALDVRHHLVDTADVLCVRRSEEIVGAALRGRRDDVVLATKFHNSDGPDQNQRVIRGAGS